MANASIRKLADLPNDVFREKLAQTIERLESWAEGLSASATIDIERAETYWRLSVTPTLRRAASLELLLQANQRFSLKLGDEVYQDKPLHDFDLLLAIVDAVEHGRVDRIETCSAATGALEIVETRVELRDGWTWIGERRLRAAHKRGMDPALVRREKRFLPYRR